MSIFLNYVSKKINVINTRLSLFGGGRVVQWCWVNFQCWGVLQFGYSRARAYCTRSRCGWGLFGHFYSQLSFLSSFSLSLGDGSIWTEILSQRAVKPKTTNQPTNFHYSVSFEIMSVTVQEENIGSLFFKHPANIFISGPSGSGKTEFVKKN